VWLACKSRCWRPHLQWWRRCICPHQLCKNCRVRATVGVRAERTGSVDQRTAVGSSRAPHLSPRWWWPLEDLALLGLTEPAPALARSLL